MGNTDQWDALVGELYEIILEPSRLPDVLAQCDRWLGSELSHLMGWDNRAGTATISVLSDKSYDDAGEAYASYYGQIDPRRYHAQAGKAGQIWACHDHFDASFVSKSEFYQDFLIPRGPRYVLGGMVHKTDNISAFIVFNHMVGQGEFSAEQREGLGRLMPHLQRALRLTLSADKLRAGTHAGEQGMTALGQAVFTLDGIGHIAFLNASAESLIREDSVLQATGQRLAGKGVNGGRFSAALARVRAARRAESLVLHDAADRAKSYLVSILPVPRSDPLGRHQHTLSRGHGSISSTDSRTSWMSYDPDLVVMVVPQHRRGGATPRILSELFQLSDAEARLAHGLSSGLSVEEFAGANAISVATARTQLRAVLAKTGERRQHDLVRMLALLPTRD